MVAKGDSGLTGKLILTFCLVTSTQIVSSFPSISFSYPNNQTRLSSPPSSSSHGVLIAGTSGWFNYRHQSNVAHGYSILRSHGVPAENIIVLSVDDVAFANQNPFKGKLFNSPAGDHEVYSGLKIDYSDDQVTPDNFIDILMGANSSTLPKVLRSSREDNVFIYISSYGSLGMIGFPSDILTSTRFTQTLVNMYNNQRFGRLMVYLDTDYSGSMFDSSLPTNINVYGVSSTSPIQVNYACYCDSFLIPFTCLGNSFSVAWLSDSGSRKTLNGETLSEQFDTLIKSLDPKASPKESTISPQQYGGQEIASLSVGTFLGIGNSEILERSIPITDQIKSFDVPLLAMKNSKFYSKDTFQNTMNARKWFDRAMFRLIDDLCMGGQFCSNATNIMKIQPVTLFSNRNTYNAIVNRFNKDCLNLGRNTYALSKMYTFVNIINERKQLISDKLDTLLSNLYQSCRRHICRHPYTRSSII